MWATSSRLDPVPVIFISYRRGDTEGQAGHLFEGLRQHFGEDRVFMDVTDIGPGRDFRVEIERAVGSCDVLLAVIGKEWLQCQTPNGERRLDDPEDLVRLEVAAALRRNIPVIPVLVGGASMPGPRDLPENLRPLAQRQAVELRHTHWDSDEAALIHHLDTFVFRRDYRRPLLMALTALLLTLAGWAAWTFFPRFPSDEVTVLVADFDGPDSKSSGVTEMVIKKLTEATRTYEKVRVASLRRAITEADGSDVARKEGRKRRAAIVIWGWYRQTKSTVNLSANFELLDAPQYMPVLGRLVRSRAESPNVADLDWINNATEMENYQLHTTLSDELAYLTLFTLGMVRYVAEDWDGAIEHFTDALALTADQASKLLGHNVIYYKRGFSYAAKGDFERAIADYGRAIELDPGNADYWIGRGVTRLRKGDDAIADFDRAIQLKPDNALAYNNRAAAYSGKRDFGRAVEDYSRAIALNPRDPYFYQHRAQAYRALGEHDRAIADYGVALTLRPDEAIFYPEGALDPARLYYERAASYSAKGDYQRAIDDLTDAIRRKPDFFLAYHDRGLAYRARGETRRAIADFSEAIRLQPSDFSAYNNRGNAYHDLGRFDDAIADFGRAIERQADSAATYNNRGNAFVGKGDVARAVADFDHAISIDPKYVLAYHNRCIAYLSKGDLARAVADCGEAIRLAPEDPLPYNDRGLAYFRKGDFDGAIADYDAALTRKPDYSLARENRKQAIQARANALRGGVR
jgi:tetratricopeptide (TPR) repeat protein